MDTETTVRSTRLVQFTDTHLLPDTAASLRGARPHTRLQACVDHARRHYFPADAIVVTGDVVHDEPAAYRAVADMLGPLGVPVLLVPGNHDVPAAMRGEFASPPYQVGGEWRAASGWQVVLLESWYAASVNGEGRLGAAQIEALEQALVRSRDPHAFVFVHHPPLPMDAAALDALGLVDGPALCAALDRHPRVRGVCWGHAHQALDVFTAGERRWMCTPATSMQFRPRHPTFASDDRPPGYRVIDLRSDGGITSEVAWLEGYVEGS